MLLLSSSLISCNEETSARRTFGHAQQTLLHGEQALAQVEADHGYRRFLNSSPYWSWKFRILEADALMRQGLSHQVLNLLSAPPPHPDFPQFSIPVLTVQALAHARLHQFRDADQELSEAERLCTALSNENSCGAVPRARGILALEQGQFFVAQQQFEKTLQFARSHGDEFLESTALLNLSASSLQQNHFDDAIEWSRAAQRLSAAIGAEDVAQVAVGNLGWAYYKLGDLDKALESFIAADHTAEHLGHILGQVYWLYDIGYVHLDRANYPIAEQFYLRALTLARQINAKEYIRNALIPLSLVYEREGRFDEANNYADQAIASARADGNRLDELYPLLVKGQVAAARHETAEAAKVFREVASDPVSDASLRWEAQHSLAQVYEDTGHNDSANHEYRTALCTFENARSSLKREESQLPFLTNAVHIYDDYIHFLISSGQSLRALQVADFSRAQTLEEGLGLLKKKDSCSPSPINPQAIAAKIGSAILFYWLGEKQSYLWAVTSRQVRLFSLPPAAQIQAAVRRYHESLVNLEDVLATSNQDGAWLYQTLIAAAAPVLGNGKNVVIVPDGSLNSLNFETLLVPGPAPHYWIEDATVTNCNSLRLLARAKAITAARNQKMLLIGDPIPHTPEYGALPNAEVEIKNIERHFSAADVIAYTQSAATASAYLGGKPEEYGYIHFVAHAVASSQVPLDSAVILSSSAGDDASFKLYARDIIQHPLKARLVTISACYGAGTRSYSGEGLVGLSWAFLRAGAHDTIGALWEINDASTPQLMDDFYAELQKGRTPDVALRDAKLAMIRSSHSLRRPFFWAPFQLYAGS